MKYNFDWVKSENFSLDWLQGHFEVSSLTDIFSAFSEIGFDADSFVYYYDMNSRFYRDTFTYAPAMGDIRIMYNAMEKDWHSASDPFMWTDSNNVDHRIALHSKAYCKYELQNFMLPSFEVTDREELNQHFYLSVSGDGLRFLRKENLYIPFLKVLRAFDFHCTRLDIALDIYDKDNGLVNLIDEAFMYVDGQSETMVTTYMQRSKNIRRYTNTYGFDRPNPNTFALSFGNHGSSSGMLRIYDKLHEMLYGNNSRVTKNYVSDIDYWYRYELEAHNDFAWNLFNYIIDECEFNLAPAFVLISDRLFKLRIANWNDTHHERYEIHDFYAAFLTHIIQNIEFADKLEIQTRTKREDSWRLYVLNMCKVFFAINKCLASEWIDDVSNFVEKGSTSFEYDVDLKMKCSSFKDYYLKLGSELYYKDDDLISRVEAFNLRDVI